MRRTFDRVAMVLFETWEEGWGHTRLLDEPLVPNWLVEVGQSCKGAEYREHVVPLRLVYNECETMFASGKPLSTVARFLEHHVKIVRVSREEQRRIDYELGLKTRMPPGWVFNEGDIYARLRAAGVEWEWNAITQAAALAEGSASSNTP